MSLPSIWYSTYIHHNYSSRLKNVFWIEQIGVYEKTLHILGYFNETQTLSGKLKYGKTTRQ